MEENFVPECYFDTVLVKTILRIKYVNHRKGCSNVVKEIKEGKLKDDFAVGIIDKDKRELDYIKDECREEITSSKLVLLKHKTKQHYFIQLAPAIEKWILNVADKGNVNMTDCGLPSDLNGLKRVTKSVFVNENEKLKNLCRKLVNSHGVTISTLTSWLQYLYTHNRNADINAMKEIG